MVQTEAVFHTLRSLCLQGPVDGVHTGMQEYHKAVYTQLKTWLEKRAAESAVGNTPRLVPKIAES